MRGDGPVKPGEEFTDAPWPKNKSTNSKFSLQTEYLKDHCGYVRNLKGCKKKA